MRKSIVLALAIYAIATLGVARANSGPVATPVPLPSDAGSQAAPAPTAAAAAEAAPGTGSPLHATFTNTVRYDAALRLKSASPALAGQPFQINENDGDAAFGAGQIVSNRADVLSELDISSEHFGARFSGSAWYDAAYNGHNALTGGSTVNQQSVPFNNFSLATTNVDGRGAQLLDAFVYANGSLGSVKLSARLGQHALLWGETLFFGGNGIAGGMAPIDVIQAQSYPAAEFKEIVLPTPQISTQLQLSSDLSLGGYYQLRWRGDRIPGVGSFFSDTDIYNAGGDTLLIGPVTIPTPRGPLVFPNAYLARGSDEFPSNRGQFGVDARFRPPGTGLDIGAYFIQFSEKAGTPYLFPGQAAAPPAFGRFAFVYPQGIRVFALSLSKSVGDFNLAGEASYRTNQDLLSNAPSLTVGSGPHAGAALDCGGAAIPTVVANNTTLPCYAIGDTLHANGSILWTLPENPISKEGSFVAEVGWQHLLGVTANSFLLDPYVSKNNTALQFVYTPTFRKVLKRTDLDIPISYRVGIQGTGAVPQILPSGGVGDVTAGLRATYELTTVFALNYTHFIGPTGAFNDAQTFISGQQTFSDRDFLSASISRSF
jgi:hypothetical protein